MAENELRPDFSKLRDPESGMGLIPAVVQSIWSREVLMVGFMNEEAFRKTLEIGKATFWSRTRQQLWTKGETSGNFLGVVSVQLDCDSDTLLIKARESGPACHRVNRWTCFE